MEHAVALDLTVPRVVSDGGMVSMVSAIQIQNKKEFVRSLRSIEIMIIVSMILMILLYLGARHLR